jgi:hypothetical protein
MVNTNTNTNDNANANTNASLTGGKAKAKAKAKTTKPKATKPKAKAGPKMGPNQFYSMQLRSKVNVKDADITSKKLANGRFMLQGSYDGKPVVKFANEALYNKFLK